jgi:hypothetical protein
MTALLQLERDLATVVRLVRHQIAQKRYDVRLEPLDLPPDARPRLETSVIAGDDDPSAARKAA